MCQNSETSSKNIRILGEEIAKNERTKDDLVINNLLQQQLQIIENISDDPRQAYQQIQEIMPIANRLENRILAVEPNEYAAVRHAAACNSRQLKIAVGVLLVGAASMVIYAGITYFASVVTTVPEVPAKETVTEGAKLLADLPIDAIAQTISSTVIPALLLAGVISLCYLYKESK